MSGLGTYYLGTVGLYRYLLYMYVYSIDWRLAQTVVGTLLIVIALPFSLVAICTLWP